ncbi:hypothetical protein ACFL27_23770 [candidate division CSSED10-310 bacterium]|uniref:Type II secretion system protein GspE N-terminal domain-containing protein n=1 Tax=candidate division CSSED10-310 bacterium TaxID=2855610 RepID=A0ABV6Z4F9_UNCC1
MSKKLKLGEILVKTKMISEEQLKVGLAYQRQWGMQLGEAMNALGFVTEYNLLRVLSHQLRIPAVNLYKVKIQTDVLALISSDFAESHCVFPVKKKIEQGKDHLLVATTDPTNLDLLNEIQFLINMPVKYVVATRTSIKKSIQKYYFHLDIDFTDETEDRYLLFKDVKDEEFVLLKADTMTMTEPLNKVKPGKKTTAPAEEEKFPQPDSAVQYKISKDSRAIVNLLIKKGIITKQDFIDEFYKT